LFQDLRRDEMMKFVDDDDDDDDVASDRFINSQEKQWRYASQISDKPYQWQFNSETSNRWQASVSSVTVIIYRRTTISDPTSRVGLHIAKFIEENNF